MMYEIYVFIYEVDVWNSLETNLNEVNSYNTCTFKKKIKQHFLLYTITNI
jgi:hypothetical protein